MGDIIALILQVKQMRLRVAKQYSQVHIIKQKRRLMFVTAYFRLPNREHLFVFLFLLLLFSNINPTITAIMFQVKGHVSQ